MALLFLVLSGAAFFVSFVLTGSYLAARERPLIGGILGIVIGVLTAWPLLLLTNHFVEIERSRNDALEVNSGQYQRIARVKGVHCSVDREIAEAMKDGRVSQAESREILSLNQSQEKDAYRSMLKDGTSLESCHAAGAAS